MKLSPVQERALALAGLAQACYLVTGIARTGMVSEDSMAGSLESLFIMNPDETLDVYRDGNGVRTGLRLITEILGDLRLNDHGDTVRYVMAVLNLTKRLSQQPDLMRAIGAGISGIQEHRNLQALSVTSEETIDRLSDLYEETAGNAEPRIRVYGLQKHLQNRTNTCRIRALLLAAVRAAVLWRQVGGRGRQWLLSRGKLVRGAESLSEILI